MSDDQYKTVIARIVDMIDRNAPKATTAAEVEALAAAVTALSMFSKT